MAPLYISIKPVRLKSVMANSKKVKFLLLPTRLELDLLVKSLQCRGVPLVKDSLKGRFCFSVRDHGLFFFQGGLGSDKFYSTAGDLLRGEPRPDALLCLGSGGALVPHIYPGQILLGSRSLACKKGLSQVSHDHVNAADLLKAYLEILKSVGFPGFLEGPILSLDENIQSQTRRDELHRGTGALVTAWEGAGGARACDELQVPFAELRVVSDFANLKTPQDFKANLPLVMDRLALAIMALEGLDNGEQPEDLYRGLVIKEAFQNPEETFFLPIHREELWRADNPAEYQPSQWTAQFLNLPESSLEALTSRISKELKKGWYVDLRNSDECIIVYPDRVFRYDRTDLETRSQAMEYGKAQGIPQGQLDWPV